VWIHIEKIKHTKMSELLNQLNTKQQEAVIQTEGPVLILAGAGSGKTRTLTHRVAYLIKEKNVIPQNILAVTFTNKAAGEMADRIKELLGLPTEQNIYSAALPTMGTFHSICVRILRREIEHIGYKSSFVIYDDQDQKALMRRVMKELDISDKEIKPNVILSVVSSAKNQLQDAKEYEQGINSYQEELIAKCFYRYQQELKKADALDFDDLIMKTVRLFELMPPILEKYQNLFQYIMVDEYQDTNKAQYKLLRMLANKNKNICVVGDDYQSVYRWRGADISNILNFEKDYQSVKTVLLEQNYRSTQTILDVADCVISNNEKQKKKKLWTENKNGELVTLYQTADEKDEAKFVVDEIQKLQKEENMKLDEVAVLYRTNAQSRALEEFFMKAGVPYKIVGGLKFYQRKEIKDVVAYLYFVNNPKDRISFERIINEPKRGLGGKTIEKILALTLKYDENILETLKNLSVEKEQGNLQLPPTKIKDLGEFAGMIEKFQEYSQENTPRKLIEKVYEETGYRAMLDKMGDEGAGRQENILELLTVAKEYDELSEQSLAFEQNEVERKAELLASDKNKSEKFSTLQKFLEDVTLVSQTDRDLDFQAMVPLMTMHSAKGLEYKVVFVVGVEEGLFPHSRATMDNNEMEEERRLCYVAVTRAKEKLYFIYTNTRNIYGSRQTSIKSRFIDEIDSKFFKEGESDSIGNGYGGSGFLGDDFDDKFFDEKENGTGRRASKAWPLEQNDSGAKGQAFSERLAEGNKINMWDFGKTKKEKEDKFLEGENTKKKNNFNDGQKVKHEIFGEGIVISSDDEMITVVFEGIGVKKLAKKIVQLKKVW
jgi:DNA helicase-2/ATP-dependent DNA helicase PcrA